MPDLTPERWQQIGDIYDAARQCDPASRSAFLEGACGADQDLRRRIELMLAKDSVEDQILDQPAAAEFGEEQPAEVSGTALAAGQELGPYRIETLIGAGGMGKVYKARDTRLGRAVAIKVADHRFSNRFEREARAVAALNHANICQLYDVGPNYLVLEYVEGIPVGPINNLRKMLDAAVQLADGMAAAHAAGFVHRDLKPANVLITAEGRVKILDFGLAKTISKPSGAEAAPDNSPTQSLTEPGVVAGTAAYMSPEQASGSANLDARTDQFSCGLLLYEMVGSKRAFKRPSVPETLAAIIREEPEPLPASVPAPLRWIIARCLAKEPRDRYESSRDLYLELRMLRERLADVSTSYAALPTIQTSKQTRWRAAALFAVGALVTVPITLFLDEPPPSNELRLTPFAVEPNGQTDAMWSPDGKSAAYSGRLKAVDPFHVYVRNLDSPVGTDVTRFPEQTRPASWTSKGRIIFQTLREPPGLWSISQVGGEAEPLVRFQRGTPYGQASVSRDGSAAAMTHVEKGKFGVWISTPPGAPAKMYEPAPFSAPPTLQTPSLSFSPDGKRLLLVSDVGRGVEAWLLPYPPDQANPPKQVLQKLPKDNAAGFSWMPDNRHIVISTSIQAGSPPQLYLADTVSGEFSLLAPSTTAQVLPAVSPDGSKVLFTQRLMDEDVVTVDLRKLDPAKPELASAAVTPLIATQRLDQMPAWAAREEALVYVTDRTGEPEIWLHKPGQLDRPVVRGRDFSESTSFFSGPALSPDATRVIYRRGGPGRGGLWISSVAGGAPVPLVKGDTERGYPGSWSPDGSKFVYLELRQGHVALQTVRTTGEAEPESVDADVQGTVGYNNTATPLWSPAGDWILYFENGFKLISPDGKVTRPVEPAQAGAYVFSPDGKTLYGTRRAGDRIQVFSISVRGGPLQVIGWLGPEYAPTDPALLSRRYTFAPDGHSLTYSVGRFSQTIWLLEGLTTPKHGLLERLGLR